MAQLRLSPHRPKSQRSSLIIKFVGVVTIATDDLASANRTAFDITAGNMEFVLENTAVPAGMIARSPIVGLFAVPHPRSRDATYLIFRFPLGSFDAFWPALSHFVSTINHAA
jgi:hypothetical protein